MGKGKTAEVGWTPESILLGRRRTSVGLSLEKAERYCNIKVYYACSIALRSIAGFYFINRYPKEGEKYEETFNTHLGIMPYLL